MRPAQYNQLLAALDSGGRVRFVHATCQRELVLHNGEVLRLDGRTYWAFLRYTPIGLKRIETGTAEAGTLVIEWSKAATLDPTQVSPNGHTPTEAEGSRGHSNQ